jgi:hypothetical protein
MNITTWTGGLIGTPAIIKSLPIDTYHSDCCVGPSISSTGLRTIFNDSPAHYWDTSYLNPNRAPQKDSAAFILGRAVHHVCLKEPDFDRYFITRPAQLNGKDWNGNRTDCREWMEMAGAQGLTVLTPDQIEAIEGMRLGLEANPLVAAGALEGLVEHSMLWQDDETGIWLKARPDVIPTASADFADVKSAVDVSDDGIEKAIGDYGIHMQAALVGMGCRALMGCEMQSFSLVFAEKARPHVARVKTLKPADISLGEQQIRLALKLFIHCRETGEWPGPGGIQSDAEYVEIKPWARTQIERRMAVIQQELAAA